MALTAGDLALLTCGGDTSGRTGLAAGERIVMCPGVMGEKGMAGLMEATGEIP